jgi:hypothetical protein
MLITDNLVDVNSEATQSNQTVTGELSASVVTRLGVGTKIQQIKGY